MAFEARPNSTNVFHNDRKASDTHADFTGSMDIELSCPHCKETVRTSFWVNVWKKMTSAQKTYLSLAIRQREYREKTAASQDKMMSEPKEKPKSSLDDEIPW